MNIQKLKISDLKPAPYNPRKSTKEQEQKLKESLQKFGIVEPVIFNQNTGYIVGGHFRVRELKKLGYTEIDCVIVNLSEEDEKELNIRLNANTGEWDMEALKNWDADQLVDWGLNIDLKIDRLKDSETLHIDKSLQILPKMEYIVIIAEDGSEDWESLKNIFKCKLVRQGGCTVGSSSDKATTGLQRVFNFTEFKERMIHEFYSSNTK